MNIAASSIFLTFIGLERENFDDMDRKALIKIILYSALFISVAVNGPQLLLLKQDNPLFHFRNFDGYEFTFRLLYNFIFCVVFFYININRNISFSASWKMRNEGKLLLIDAIVFLCFSLVGYVFNVLLFKEINNALLPGQGYGLRLGISALLIATELKIIHLVQKNRQKDIENEHLRNANLKTELEVLKGQLNPHFFFNALSSLSGIVRENPQKAQHYINQLSKFFRYTLQKNDNHLVSLADELAMLNSYTELLKMRHEAGFGITIMVGKEEFDKQIPHMSLQPVVENAVKHNVTGIKYPLHITIYMEDGFLVIKNNLQPLKARTAKSGIGLANLNER
ncbi:MAG: histidine kinase, partial [Chitinophagaceae bacterium]|nr:histidine kinase [Chitinophagaceae bacterium]